MPTLRNPGRRALVLADARPNTAAEQAYHDALTRAVRTMATSTMLAVERAYAVALASAQAAEQMPDPDAERAEDAAPSNDRRRLFRVLDQLRDHWDRHFRDLAKRIAAEFVERAYRANKSAWQSRVRRDGFDVPMKLTSAQRAIMDVKVADNVALIRSIPEKYFTQIVGDVSRGFLAGRDLEAIAERLRRTGHSTVKRAALIARDQSNKLTAQMNGARHRELGIQFAYWKHSTVEKDPRPNHLRASREGWVFDTQVGIDFGDQFGFVLPGAAINCRCGSRSIIPALDEPITSEDLEPVPGFPGAFRRKRPGA